MFESGIIDRGRDQRIISRAIAREWNTIRHVADGERLGIFLDPEFGHTFMAEIFYRDDHAYASHAWAWFDSPAEARLYVLRHLGIILPS